MTLAAELPRRAHRNISELLDRYSRVSTAVLAVGFLIYLKFSYDACRDVIWRYDWMQITGSAAFFLGVVPSFGMRRKFRMLIDKLIESGAIVPRGSQDHFETAVRRSVGRWCAAVMVVLTGLILGSYIHNDCALVYTISSAWAASVAGERFGRLIAYALAAGLIARSGGTLNINFWHPDNAGGWLPFSRFYLYCGVLTSIAPIWLAVWWVAIPWLRNFTYDYSSWSTTLVELWVVSVAFFVLSFVVPISLIHRRMATARDLFMAKLAWIPRALDDLHRQMEAASDEAQVLPIYTRIEKIQKLYETAASVTTWPLDKWVLRRFTGATLVQIALPFVLKLVPGPLGEALKPLIEG